MSRWRRIRPRPRCPACSPPATSPTRSTGRRSPPPASAAWPRSRPNDFSRCARASARRRNRLDMARTRDGFTAMDWDKLKVFHAVAEAGSFTHAGEELGLTQSAVSRQVSALEEELSVLAVPPPCARPDPDRAGRAAVPHRARGVHAAAGGARQADRQPRAAERRPQDHHARRRSAQLADPAARRVHRRSIPRSASR